MWGGLLGTIAMTGDMEPDPRFAADRSAPPIAPPVTLIPTMGEDRLGLAVAGTF
jgi:hypothetical protein